MTPIHQNMKPIVQIVGMALACTCLAAGYTCFTIDAPHTVNCATAWVDTGTVIGVTVEGRPVTGVCTETVEKEALRVGQQRKRQNVERDLRLSLPLCNRRRPWQPNLQSQQVLRQAERQQLPMISHAGSVGAATADWGSALKPSTPGCCWPGLAGEGLSQRPSRHLKNGWSGKPPSKTSGNSCFFLR